MAIPTEAIIAGISGLGGIGTGGAVLRYFAERWAREREEREVKLEAELEAVRNRCEERDRSAAVIKGELQAEFRASIDGLRAHADTELTRISNRNHELSNSLGVVMNEIQNQARVVSAMVESMRALTEKVQECIVAVTSLSARLEGAQLLRRTSDMKGGG